MNVLGLTGGIGMGKSACADLLRQRGVCVIDTDDLARKVVQPGQPAISEIHRVFGAEFITPEGGLDRKLMAKRVFSDPAARQQLESILHPPIRDAWHQQIERWRKERATLAVVVIPLLFETQAENELDAVLCVACSAATQAERVRTRGWSPEQLRQRIASQWPIQKKIDASDYVIWSEGQLAIHAAQLSRILERFEHRAPAGH